MQIKEISNNKENKEIRKSKSLATTLWEIHEAKNKRFKEKLDFLKLLFDQHK